MYHSPSTGWSMSGMGDPSHPPLVEKELAGGWVEREKGQFMCMPDLQLSHLETLLRPLQLR